MGSIYKGVLGLKQKYIWGIIDLTNPALEVLVPAVVLAQSSAFVY